MEKGNIYSSTHETTVIDTQAHRLNKLSYMYAKDVMYVVNHEKKLQVAYTNIHFPNSYASKILKDISSGKQTQPFLIDEVYDSNGIVYYRSSRYADALSFVSHKLPF